jgi:hypothetical protein
MGLHAVKSYKRPSSFTSNPRGRCAADFYPLKNPSPWPGSNPQPLGPVASTLTTTPPRQHVSHSVRLVAGRRSTSFQMLVTEAASTKHRSASTHGCLCVTLMDFNTLHSKHKNSIFHISTYPITVKKIIQFLNLKM